MSYRSSFFSFRSNHVWPSYGPWTLKLDQIFSCHHFVSLCLEILTWFLVYDCMVISYRCSLLFVPVQRFLAELWPLDFEIYPNIFLLCLEILTCFLVYECIMISYRSNLHFVPVQWFLAEFWLLDFEIWPNILLSSFFCFAMRGDIDLIFGTNAYECIMMSYKSSILFVPVQRFLAKIWCLNFEIWTNI